MSKQKKKDNSINEDIPGIVTCKECGGVFVSHSGRAILNPSKNKVICWHCGREISADLAYKKRKGKEEVML